MEASEHYRSEKRRLRRKSASWRPNAEQQEAFSRRIGDRILALSAFAAARVVMTYLDFRNEVCTRPLLPELWTQGKTVIVPYCTGEDLGLFPLENLGELAPGAWGILEPRPELRGTAGKRAKPELIDLALIPGAAFDRCGGRLGRGKGFYDRFLPRLRPDALKIGLAFECQLLESIPMTVHDVCMDFVITEFGTYGRGR
jgi:5-formyltetrahydrofolate cyclo-ligase